MVAVTGRRSVPWIVSTVAGMLLLRAMLGQAAIQTQLNQAMQGVLLNVSEAGRLTRETSEALAPMASTARTLETMNERLRNTRLDLLHMNETFERILSRQQSMLSDLGSINQSTRGIVGRLGDLDQHNQDLLLTTASLADQTESQAIHAERLAGLTEESISHLKVMNRRFSFLR